MTVSRKPMVRAVGLASAPLFLALAGCQGPMTVQSNIGPISPGGETVGVQTNVESEIKTGPTATVDAGRMKTDPASSKDFLPPESGKGVYQVNCVSCHAMDGKPTAPGVPDLSDPVYSWTRTPQEYFRDLRVSPAHSSRLSKLPPQQIWNAVFFSWSLHTNLSDLATGGLLFNRNCSVCHGTKGLGDGNLSNDLNPPPRRFTDFKWMADKTDQRFYISLNDGRAPSAMPSWKGTLSPTQFIQIINYLRQFTYQYPQDIAKKMAETPPPS